MESVRRVRTNAKGAFNRSVLNLKQSLKSYETPIEYIDELLCDVKKIFETVLKI